MKKHLLTSLLICGYCSAAAEAEESPLSKIDLKYEDSEEIYRRIFGHVDQQEDVLLDMDVLVDGEKSGSAPTFTGKSCKIQAAALKNCLADYLESEDISVIDQCKDEDGFVEFKNLNSLSLKTKLNRLTMQVEVSLPLDKKKERSFRGRRKFRQKPNVEPANFSAVVNTRVSQSFNKYRFSSDNKKIFVITPFVNLFGLCVEGEATYQDSSKLESESKSESKRKDSKKKGKFRRDYTTVVYDWVEPDIMFRYGDIFTRSLSYQSPPRVWGFNINKDTEREKHEGFASPIRITLLKTSTIEIYSNNHLIRTRTNVPPGTYILDDISYISGENDIKIKIIDESGREEILDKSFFYESAYVPKGKFTFNGTYGYPQINDPIKVRYDRTNPLLSLTLKYGLLSATELGCGLLKNKAGKTCSYEIRNKNILGNFDLKFATSNYEVVGRNMSGKVYHIQYSSPSMKLSDKTRLSFFTEIKKSDNFFRPYLAKNDTNLKFDNTLNDNILKSERNLKGKNTSVSYRVSLSNILSFNTGVSYCRKKNFEKKSSNSISWDISRGFNINGNLFNNGNISVNFSRHKEFNGERKKSFSIYCSLSAKNNINLSNGYSKTNEKSNSYLSVSHSPDRTGLSYDVTAERSDDSKKMKVNTIYTNSVFKGNLNYSRDNKGARSAKIGAESAIYFADGRFAVARTDHSDGGFVLVSPKKDLSRYKIKFLDKDAESGFLGGGAVLSNSRISSTVSRIDLREIPDNINLKQDTIISQGQYRRGFIADIQGTKSVTACGILVDSRGKILEQVTGFAINKDNTDETPVSFFTNLSGEFYLTELKPGNYKLTVNIQNTESIEVEIKETVSDDDVLDLGTVVCKDSVTKEKIDEEA